MPKNFKAVESLMFKVQRTLCLYILPSQLVQITRESNPNLRRQPYLAVCSKFRVPGFKLFFNFEL